jgi:hypothetical protein
MSISSGELILARRRGRRPRFLRIHYFEGASIALAACGHLRPPQGAVAVRDFPRREYCLIGSGRPGQTLKN